MPQVALANTFLESYSRLPRSIQKKTRHLTEKLRRDPNQPGVGLEKLSDAYDDKLYSARINQTYRAILVHPRQDDLFLVVWVDHHDDAYRWARRRRCEVHATTGAVQVFQVSEEQAAVASLAEEEPERQQWEEPIPEGRLFEGMTDQELTRCGVPYQLLPSVRALKYEYDLDEVADYLPEEAADALYMVAAGSTVDEAIREARGEAAPRDDDEPVDTDDFVSALEHPDSRRRFKLIDDDEDLADMLNAPLELWRVFLHPTQREIVERSVNGPVRVLGGPGTGKTVVLMHRASWLAREVFADNSDRLLVTTFTANLAADLEEQLHLLCGDEFDRIEVTHLHRWAMNFMRSQGVRFDVVSSRQQREFWQQVYDLYGENHSLQFYRDEWRYVVQAQAIASRRDYLRARRRGRGNPLRRGERRKVWKVLEAYRRQLDEAGKVDWGDVIRETRLYLEKNPGVLPYRAVLADEVQDLSQSDLKLLRAMVPQGNNDLFLVGDGHQRIYGHKASFSSCGINIRGRHHAYRLKLNYRTTEHIRDWAVALLKGVEVDDLDDGVDELDGYRSLRRGARPAVRQFDTAQEEARAIVECIQSWKEQGFRDEEICLAVRTSRLIEDRYRPRLEDAGIATAVIETESEEELGAGVRLSTMHRMKGLEFPAVILASVQRDVVPLRREALELDEDAYKNWETRERSLLYVSATRARDELVITGFGEPSPFVEQGDPSV